MSKPKTIAQYLKSALDVYAESGAFEVYLKAHADEAADFLRPHNDVASPFRASSGGSCLQAQCFSASGEPVTNPEDRPAAQHRALHNGTFMHARYHLYFRALQERGELRILGAEEFSFDPLLKLSGHIDCHIELPDGRRAVVDFKSINKWNSGKLDKGPKPEHEEQQYRYHILGWQADEWVMVYEHKDSNVVTVFGAPYDPIVVARIRAEHELALAWLEDPSRRLPLMRQWCGYCKWRDRCKEINGE